jgi:hypothetical protein
MKEISVSRNFILIVGIVLVVIIALLKLVTSGYINFQDIGSAIPPQVSQDEPVLESATAFYSLGQYETREAWEAAVCAHATEDGCAVFQQMYAPAMWESAAHGSASVGFVRSIETEEDGSQIWELTVSDGTVAVPAFVHTEKDDTGRWLFKRILFSQEASRYLTETQP